MEASGIVCNNLKLPILRSVHEIIIFLFDLLPAVRFLVSISFSCTVKMQRYTSCGPDSFDIADDRFILMDADDHERHIQA